MNLVLTGGMASPSAGGKALSPGRSSSPPRVPPPAPPTLVPVSVPAPAPMAPVPTLSAAQQAQMIAQHNLLVRQGAERDLLLQCMPPTYQPIQYIPPQTHLSSLAASPAFNLAPHLGHMKPYMSPSFLTHNPYLLLSPRLLAPRPPLTPYSLPPPTAPAYLSQLMSSQHHAVKRSYDHAFSSAADAAAVAAKRPFAGYGPTIPTSSAMPTLAHLPPAYTQFYPSI